MSETPTDPTTGTNPAVADQTTASYDPADFSYTDVLAYLGEHPETVAQVQAAEATGKNRKSIMEYEVPAVTTDPATYSEPAIQAGTEDYDRRVIYPPDHPEVQDAVPVPEDATLLV